MVCYLNSGLMSDSSKNERDFFRIVSISTGLALGTMAAFLYSMKDLAHDATLEFTPGTVVAFVLGAAAGWGFWRGIKFLNRAKRK